jgi:hypothetical protein
MDESVLLFHMGDIIRAIGDATSSILDEGAFLFGALFGGLLTHWIWKRQFRHQAMFEILKDTSTAIGMFIEDVTNPDRTDGSQAGTEPASVRRSFPMRPETSSLLAQQQLLVGAAFGTDLADQLRSLVSGFDTVQDPTGNKFVQAATVLVAAMMKRAGVRPVSFRSPKLGASGPPPPSRA